MPGSTVCFRLRALEQAGLLAPVKFDPVLSAVVDAPSTMLTDGTALTVYAWYDNEMGLCPPHGRRALNDAPGSGAGRRNSAIATAAYRGFKLTDGALRMLVLLHVFRLGYLPFSRAFLFLLYEAAGIGANLTGGWLATRFGIARMLPVGLVAASARRTQHALKARAAWPHGAKAP